MYTKARSQGDSTALAVFCDTHTHTQAARWVSRNLCCCLSSHFFKSLDNFELYHSHLSQGRWQMWAEKVVGALIYYSAMTGMLIHLSIYTKAASKPSFIVYLWSLWGWWLWFRLICDFLSCSYSGASMGLLGGSVDEELTALLPPRCSFKMDQLSNCLWYNPSEITFRAEPGRSHNICLDSGQMYSLLVMCVAQQRWLQVSGVVVLL